MSLDLMPRPGSAPWISRVRSQAAFELGILIRNGEQFLLTIVIPVAVLIGLAAFRDAIDVADDDILARALALAVIATAFTALAIGTGFERRSGSLQLLATTPIHRIDVLVGKAVTVLIVELVQTIILILVALLLGLPIGSIPLIVVGIVLGTWAFATLGFTIAGVMRAEAVLAIANALFLFFLIVGGITVAAASFPSWWSAILPWLPSGALVDLLSAAVAGGFDAVSAIVLLAWGAVLALLGHFTFTWD